ncbi:hypothetical protein ACIBW9_37265 [Streptomyces sp. NPDC049541]|uniref:hypothetical protein n=1 Tax=Streptomyces sp. NPDC049541 TaxID=3365594 RepID=UPI0037A709C2
MADIAEDLLRHRRLPDAAYQTEWDGADDLSAAALDFRRTLLGLPKLQVPSTGARTGVTGGQAAGVQLTIDTHADTYEQAIAAVEAAYGRTLGFPVISPSKDAAQPSAGHGALSGDGLKEARTFSGPARDCGAKSR